MQQSLTISMVALFTALGGVVGTQLGRDAVADIDPVFFQERPEPTPFYDDSSSTSPAMRASTDAGYGYPYWDRGPVCWGCPGKPDNFTDPRYDSYLDAAEAPIPTSGKAVVRRVGEPLDEVTTAEPAPPSVAERYASFPVTADEARRKAHIAELQRGREPSEADDSIDREAQATGM